MVPKQATPQKETSVKKTIHFQVRACHWKERISRVLYFLVFFCELFRDQRNSEGLWFSVIEGLRRRSDRRLSSSPLCVFGIFGILTYRWKLRFLGSFLFGIADFSIILWEERYCMYLNRRDEFPLQWRKWRFFPTAKKSKIFAWQNFDGPFDSLNDTTCTTQLMESIHHFPTYISSWKKWTYPYVFFFCVIGAQGFAFGKNQHTGPSLSETPSDPGEWRAPKGNFWQLWKGPPFLFWVGPNDSCPQTPRVVFFGVCDLEPKGA